MHTITKSREQRHGDQNSRVQLSVTDRLRHQTEDWAPLPRVFHDTNELGSMRHGCETASVMRALCGPWLKGAR